MESVIIISIILGMVIIGLLLLYYGATYLYEWYIENFTVDVDPDHPEREISSWEAKLPQLEKLVGRGLAFVSQLPKVTEKLIRSVRKLWSEKSRRNKKLEPFGVPPRPAPPRKPPVRKVERHGNRPLRYRNSEDVLRAREEILGIDPADRGRGKDYWDTKFEKKKQELKKAYKDVWDTRHR